ncbi:CoA-binding protein [Caminibacter sp.]
MIKNEDIIECDINPLIINEKGAFAVDFRVKFSEKEKKVFIPKKYSIFKNKNVAIFGATDKEEKVGFAIAKNALSSKANIYFVNPKLDILFGKKVYHTYDELPQIDTAVISTPKSVVLDIVENMAKRGTKNFIIISAGFKESGDIESEKRLSELAKEYGLNIIGPNCLGIYNSELELNLTFGKSKIYRGEIGIISQSGAVLTALMDKASHYKIGFSHIISMGNMADFNFAHAIEELNCQESCNIISIYAEGIQFGKAFLEAIRNSKKSILLFKAGKSDAAKKAAMSHTGNLAGNYEMIMTLSEIAGAKIKDFAESLIFSPNFKEDEVLIISNAGGPGTILTDYASKYKKIKKLDSKTIEKLNKVLPPTWSHNNPVDIIGDATAKRYKAAIEILKNIEAVKYVIVTPQYMTETQEIAKILKDLDVVPILLGKDSFVEAEKILQNKLFFTSLQDAVSIL